MKDSVKNNLHLESSLKYNSISPFSSSPDHPNESQSNEDPTKAIIDDPNLEQPDFIPAPLYDFAFENDVPSQTVQDKDCSGETHGRGYYLDGGERLPKSDVIVAEEG